jgi:hypothetical protein
MERLGLFGDVPTTIRIALFVELAKQFQPLIEDII